MTPPINCIDDRGLFFLQKLSPAAEVGHSRRYCHWIRHDNAQRHLTHLDQRLLRLPKLETLREVWRGICFFIWLMYTDKKEKQFSSYLRKFRVEQLQSHIWLRKGFLIYEEMRTYFPIYEEAVSHIWFVTAPFWISLYMRKIWFSFLSVY